MNERTVITVSRARLRLWRMQMMDGNAIRAHVMRKAEACAAALSEARRLSAAAMFGTLYVQLAGKIVEILDELDEAAPLLDHRSDRAALERIAALHAGYQELEYRRASIGVS